MKIILKFFLVLSTLIPLVTFSSQVFSRELVVWSRHSPSQNLVDAFNKKMEAEGKDLRAVNSVLGGDFVPKFTAALAAGERVDVAAIDLIYVPYYASIGALEDMTDFLKGKQYYKNLNGPMMHLGSVDGKHYAAPNDLGISGFAYNKNLLPNPPSTWAEMTTMCEDFASRGEFLLGWPTVSAGGMIYTHAPWGWAEGGAHSGWVNEDGSKANLNDSTMQAAFDHFTNLQKIGCVPKNVAAWDWPDKQDAFLRGELAMIGTGNFIIGMMGDYPDIDWGFFAMFSSDGTRKSAFVGGDLVSIPVTTGDKEGAMEYIEFILSAEGQSVYTCQNGGLPIRSDLFDTDPCMTDNHRVFLHAGDTGHVPYTVVYNELMEPWGVAIQEIYGGGDPAEVLSKHNARMQDIIEEGPE